MSRFTITATPLAGLFKVQRHRREDPRGFFSRFFCADELRQIGFHPPIAQANHTLTRRRGAVRGLHFQQPPHAEDKFVSCLRGEVWDVAVDLRPDSPTYLRWHAEVLSADNLCSLMVPQGFAHGFQTLTDDCEMFYLHSLAFQADAEGGLNPGDPVLGITWPLAFTDVSERDMKQPYLTADFIAQGRRP